MHDSAPSVPPTLPKLSLATKLAYGAGDLGPAITANVPGFFLTILFYQRGRALTLAWQAVFC
jgi:GPH family glycoside/pentoside/hexuronide:cation symporter